MIEVKGKCYLKQNKETIPHINLELIMNYINKLHRTRRVKRNFDLISTEERKKNSMNFDLFGSQGEYY